MRNSTAYLKRSFPGIGLGTLLLIGVGGASGLWARRPPAPPQRHVLEIRGFAFEGMPPAVAPGDTLVWINRDIVPHTASAVGGAWDSGALDEGASWYLVVQERGHQAYYCRFHPGMKGSFRVE